MKQILIYNKERKNHGFFQHIAEKINGEETISVRKTQSIALFFSIQCRFSTDKSMSQSYYS
jgi:hypothetical protein